MGVASVHPTCWCRSSVAVNGCITWHWCGAADPLPHLPTLSGRRCGLALRLVAIGYGQELLARLAEWSCIQDGSPRLRSEAGSFRGGDWKVNGSGKKALGRIPRPEEDNRKLHRRGVRACISTEDPPRQRRVLPPPSGSLGVDDARRRLARR